MSKYEKLWHTDANFRIDTTHLKPNEVADCVIEYIVERRFTNEIDINHITSISYS
jgi:hypothetical protein